MENPHCRDAREEESLSILLFLICRDRNGNLNIALTKDHEKTSPEKCGFPMLTVTLPKLRPNMHVASETLRKTVIEGLQAKYPYHWNIKELYSVSRQTESSDFSFDECLENHRIQAFLVILQECESFFSKEKENVQWTALEEILKGVQGNEDIHCKIFEEALSQYAREIFQAKYSPLKLHPRALQVMKLPVPVKVCFAMSPGTLKTKEGDVTYTRGDALLTGVEGDSWPVQRSIFDATYEPIEGTRSGSAGIYVKKPIRVWAIQLDHAEDVWIGRGTNRLHGMRGDWLVEYSGERFGVVSQDIFQKTYLIFTKTPE